MIAAQTPAPAVLDAGCYLFFLSQVVAVHNALVSEIGISSPKGGDAKQLYK